MHPYSVPHQSNKYRPELDGIRALAIIAVIAYHAGVPYFSRGFVGVDFFFVISGYLITGILAHEALDTGRLDLPGFYARRIRRLMPAALFMLTICVALYVWLIPPLVGNYLALIQSIESNAFFASNFFFYMQGNGYFDESMTQFPLLHTWSLSVEEQYYLLWPLLMLVIVKCQARTSTAQHSTAQKDNLSLVRKLRGLLWVLFVASLSFCVYFTDIDNKFAFYLLPARIWEFAAGGLLTLYLMGVKQPAEVTSSSTSRARLGTGLATLGMALCILSLHFLDNNAFPYDGFWPIWPVGGTTALIAGLTLNRSGFWSRFFSLRPLVWLGLLSYSWYLWHWPLMTILKIYVLGGDTLNERIAMCLVALFAAYVSYRFVEKPVRERKSWLFATTKGSLIAGGVMVLLMLLCANLLGKSKKYQPNNPFHQILAVAQNDRAASNLCTVPDKIFKEFSICNANNQITGKTRPIIVLWGDSHADHFISMLVAKYPDHDIHLLTLSGCAPLIDDHLPIHNYTTACQAFNKKAAAHVKSINTHVERVYLSVRWPLYFGQTPISVVDVAPWELPVPGAYEIMKLGLHHTLNEILKNPVKVTLLAATPELIYHAPKCLMMRASDVCNVSRDISDAFLNPSYEALKELASGSPAIDLIDFRPYFCNETTCFASKDGRSLYTDDDHITATTARELADYLKR